jgi:hypothetical protein
LSTNLLQPSRFLAINLRSLQPCFPLLFSVVCRHEFLGLHLLLVSCGSHCRAALHSSLSFLRSVCPIQPNLRCHISLLMLIWPVISHSFSLDMTLGHQIFMICISQASVYKRLKLSLNFNTVKYTDRSTGRGKRFICHIFSRFFGLISFCTLNGEGGRGLA